MPAKKRPASTGKKKLPLAKGDHVSWTTSQGETHGVVEEKLTSSRMIKGHSVKATADNPEFLVRSDKSGEEAAHKPGSLRKKSSRK